MLGQHFHTDRRPLLWILIGPALIKQMHLSEDLVGEGPIHDPGGVTHGVAQVHQPPLRQQDDEV